MPVFSPITKLNPAEATRRLRLLANSPEGVEALGKAFGAAGALFGALMAFDQAKAASARGDSAAGVGHDVVVGANVATMTGYFLGGCAIVWGALVGSTVGVPALLAFIGVSLVTGGSAVSLLGAVIVPMLEHDPLEIWLKKCPWGLEKNKDSEDLDLQLTTFYRALAGLKIDCVFDVLGNFFSLMVDSRMAKEPEEVWVGYMYISDAGAARRAIAPLTANECVSGKPHSYELKVFAASPKFVQAEVQIRPKDEAIPCYPPKPERPSPFRA